MYGIKRFAAGAWDWLLAAFLLFAAALFLTDPARYAGSVSEGVSLWAVCVLPAVFPFLFFTALFTGLPPFAVLSAKLSAPMGKLFRVSGAGGGAAILAALSGYPVGARTVYDLSAAGKIAKEERFRLACLCSTSGPVFLVGTVGGMMYESAAAGWAMLLSHLAAVWTVCLCMRFFGKQSASAPLSPPRRALLQDSLSGAVLSVLCVGGYIALFSCLRRMLADLGLFSFSFLGEYTEGALCGLLEMTAGCRALSAVRTPLSCALSCAAVTFGGACVLCQQAGFLSRAGVKMPLFCCVKLLQAALAFLLCWGLCTAFPCL